MRSLLAYFPLGLIGLFRWTCWLIRRVPAVLYRPVTSGHREPLTVVTPVYQEDPVIFRTALESWLTSGVDEVICVIDVTDTVCMEIASEYPHCVRVVPTNVPGKRDALRLGWMSASTPLVALVDSDTIWAPDVASLVCEPFVDPEVGGVGTRQNVFQPRGMWQNLADSYLDYRYFDEAAAQTAIGQAVSCLSGRTAVYRRELLVELTDRFMEETFLGVQCMSGDDKRITTLILEGGHKTYLQRSARVWSTFPDSTRRFYLQRLRWARNTWRSDLRALGSRWIWRHPFLAFTMIDKAISPFTLLVSASFMIMAVAQQQWMVVGVLTAWWWVSRSAKLLPHLERRPRQMLFVPAIVVASFALALVKLWALVTIRQQRWLTRDVEVIDGEVVRTAGTA